MTEIDKIFQNSKVTHSQIKPYLKHQIFNTEYNPRDNFKDLKQPDVFTELAKTYIKDDVEFIATDFDAGVRSVSGGSEYSEITLKSLLFKNEHSLRLATVIEQLGYAVVNSKDEDTDVDVDLSVDNLSKDALMALFK